MKRFSKIFAMMLTVCLLCGIFAVVSLAAAPADKTTNTANDTTFNYTFDEDAVGKSYNANFPGGTGTATNSTVKVVEGENGNKYVAYAHYTDATDKAYRRDFRYAVSSQTLLNDYSFITVDFDISADHHVVQVGYKIKTAYASSVYTYTVQPDWYIFDDSVTKAEIEKAIQDSAEAFKTKLEETIAKIDGTTHKSVANGDFPALTSETVAEDYIAALDVIDYDAAMATKRLSYSNAAYFSFDNRYKYNEESAYAGGGYSRCYVYFVYNEEAKVWNICGSSNGSNVLGQLSNVLGEWNHFTFVMQTVEEEVVVDETTTKTTVGRSLCQLYFNGKSIYERTYIASSTTKQTIKVNGETITNFAYTADDMAYINPRAFDFQIPNYASKFSMGIDNFITTFYPKNYSSGDSVYGIDDLFAAEDKTLPISLCEDVVYDKNYTAPAPNVAPVIEVDGETMSIPSLAVYKIGTLRSGKLIKTNVDLLGITPIASARLTVECDYDVEITLSEAGALTHNIEATANGYAIAPKNQLSTPTVGSGNDILYGTFASNDYETVAKLYGSGWSGSHGFGVPNSTNNGPNYYINIGTTAFKTNPYNQNRYFNLRYYKGATLKNNGTNAYIEYNLSAWGNNDTDRYKGNMVGNYDFAVVDYDFGADAYSLEVGYHVVHYDPDSKKTGDEYSKIEKAYRTYTPAEFSKEAVLADIAAVKEQLLEDVVTYKDVLDADDIATYSAISIAYEDAMATKKLAYVHGANMYLGFRRYDNESDTSSSNSNIFFYTAYRNGKWGLYKSNSYTDKNLICYLPENPYETVHITFLAQLDQASKNLTLYLFVDGMFASTISDTSSNPIKCIDSVRLQMPADFKNEDAYSYIFDNTTVNFYEAGYSSGLAYGIDDYFATGDFTQPFYGCKDVVYNESYATPSGYVEINGVKSYITPVINEMLAGIANGDVIVTSKSLYNLALSESVEGITIITEDGATVTLGAAEAQKYVIETEDGETYVVRLANENDAITLEWYDAEGNLIKTELLLPNVTVNTAGVAGDVYNVLTREWKYITGWYWDIDGDGELEPVSSFTLADGLGGMVFEVTPTFETTTLPETFAIYYESNGVAHLYGTAADYAAPNALITLVPEAPDGATVILYQDKTVIGAESIYIGANKTLNFDLNGKIIYQYGIGNWSYPIFAVREGATFNFYSSVEGGEIYQARWRKENGKLTAYPGVFATANNADNLVINVGDFGPYSGDNLSIYAGTIFVGVCSEIKASTSPVSDSENIVFNINGGYYYEILDTSYALLKISAPDTIYNIRNASFYCNLGGIFWSDDRYNCDNAHIFVYDSEIYAGNKDGSLREAVWKLHGADSTIYFEGCKIQGWFGGANDNKIYIGPNNEIRWNLSAYETSSFIDYATYVDGEYVPNVEYAYANNDAYSFTFDKFALPTLEADAENDNMLTEASFGSAAPISLTSKASIVTYKAGEAPEYVKSVTFKDVDGSTLKTANWVAGSKAKAPAHSGTPIEDNYFTSSYAWAFESGEANAYCLVSDTASNVFVPKAYYTASKISGMKANMALLTDVVFNLYLPISSNVSDLYITDAEGNPLVVVEAVARDEVMYLVQWKQAINSFEAMEIVVNFTVDGTALSASVSMDPVKYATLVVGSYECGSEEAILAYEIMNYKAAIATFINPEFTDAAYDAFVATFNAHENCACKATAVEISDEEAGVDYSALDVEWVQYALSASEIGMIIKADSTADVAVSYKDYKGELVELEVTYNEKAKYFIVSAVSAAYIDNIMYITVNGETGTYCLGKYILNNPTVDVAKAIYTYAVAAENYKHVTSEEIK